MAKYLTGRAFALAIYAGSRATRGEGTADPTITFITHEVYAFKETLGGSRWTLTRTTDTLGSHGPACSAVTAMLWIVREIQAVSTVIMRRSSRTEGFPDLAEARVVTTI